jgi:DeoR/GlpR family transcriptional regulator of sugar metabolism
MMLAQQRRTKILELLQEEGSARVSSLSKLFEVSEPTIRQDLERLEADGYISREHGGAYLKTIPEQVRSLTLQHTENMDKKMRIGKKAAGLIEDGDFVILDSGTTVTEIAKNLENKKNLKIITNSLNIALILGAHYEFEVMVTGGEFKAPTLSLTGEKAANFFQQIYVNKLFLATGGISLETGLTYPGFNDLHVKKAMLESASQTYLVADSTKIGKTSFAALGPVELVQYMITDGDIDPKTKQKLENRGITVIIAD